MNHKETYSLTVFATKDYSFFQKLDGNRDSKPIHAKRLAKLIERDPTFLSLCPIIINEKGEIIDGQHRVEAVKLLKEETGKEHEIFYTIRVGLGLKEARMLNSGGKPWSPKDYAEAYKMTGNGNYIIYLNFIKSTGLNHDISVRYLAPSGYGMQTFRDGDFKVENERRSKLWFKQLKEVGETMRDFMTSPIDWRHRSFAIAMQQVMQSKNYDHERMISQLELYANRRGFSQTPMKNTDLALALQDLYNERVKEEDKQLLLD